MAAGCDPDLVAGDLVDQAVLVGDAPGPVVGEVMLERLGLPNVLVAVARNSTLALARVALNAGAACQLIDRPTFSVYLEPRLVATRSDWGELHATIRDLTKHAHRPVNRDLRLAGSELVLALGDVVLDDTAWPTPPRTPAVST